MFNRDMLPQGFYPMQNRSDLKNLEKNLELHAFREYDKVQQLTKGQRWKKTGEH